jgi:hypothetical protein
MKKIINFDLTKKKSEHSTKGNEFFSLPIFLQVGFFYELFFRGFKMKKYFL